MGCHFRQVCAPGLPSAMLNPSQWYIGLGVMSPKQMMAWRMRSMQCSDQGTSAATFGIELILSRTEMRGIIPPRVEFLVMVVVALVGGIGIENLGHARADFVQAV